MDNFEGVFVSLYSIVKLLPFFIFLLLYITFYSCACFDQEFHFMVHKNGTFIINILGA